MKLNRDVLEMLHRNRLNMVSVNKTEDIESKMLNLEFPRKKGENVPFAQKSFCTTQLPARITPDPEIMLRA